MRYTRVIPPVALLTATLTACTHTTAPTFNPTPHPTHPAQAVVIAGSPELNKDPRDGEFALRSSAYGGGGLAVSSDGTLYYRVYHGREGRVVRLGKDGRIQLHAVDIAADQMFVQGNDLWLLAAKSGLAVSKVALSDWEQSPVIEWTAQSATVKVLGANGVALSKGDARRLYRDWTGAKFFARPDGTPIVVSRAGRMFEVTGPEVLREWSPPGYAEALAKVAAGKGLRPEDAVTDEDGQSILLGRAGLLYIPRTGKARYVRFPASAAALPPWSAVIGIGNGDALLLGGTTPIRTTPRPTIVRADGRMERLSLGGFKWCPGGGGGLTTIASALPGGVVKRADGTIVLNDRRCGQVYAFKLPEPLSGTPFGR
ncbi:hypothetical protein HUT06_41080 [Actinomadura sp. NAK00032]|uniref:hypothetical protein n=1 Tax=Actinomadura sp. NAK00032 TaxID=2742128 RepID=UPI001590E695|nr:hypothetical protein [Actinomadura sp. NAK00032]QKW39638.1 hypothetical protein HUT06_41080 [Actinomadura sp. NAK00032]